MFLNALHEPALVTLSVDLNPRKQGRYVAGSAHRVAAPDELAALAPDLVLVSNATYVPEIERALGDMGLAPELLSIATSGAS